MALGTIGATDSFTLLGSDALTSWTDIGGGQYTKTFSPTIPSLGANRMGVVFLSFQNKPPNLTSVDGLTWDGVAMTLGTPVDDGTGYSIAARLAACGHNGTKNIVLTVTASAGAPSSANVASLRVVWFDMGGTISYDTAVSTNGSSDPATITTVVGGAGILLSATGHTANALAATPFPDGTHLISRDAGGNCFICGYSTPTGAGSVDHRHDYSQTGTWTGVSLSFTEAAANNPPTITPDTADATEFGTLTPALLFTGSDTDGDSLEYQIQISDNPDAWAAGEELEDNYNSGGGLEVHPNPTGGDTWNGQRQVDDRVGFPFTGNGGRITKIAVGFSKHESSGITAGYALVRIYTHAGVLGQTSGPANPAQPANTPTPGWLVVSDLLYIDESTPGTEQILTFSGANIMRAVEGVVYWASLDWLPDNYSNLNAIQIHCDNTTLGHAGNVYMDGAAPYNWGAWGLYSRRCTLSGLTGAFDIGDNIQGNTSGATATITMTGQPGSPQQIVFELTGSHTEFNGTEGVTNLSQSGSATGMSAYLNKNADAKFKIYETYILIDALSETPDAGFANVPTPADTHPFNAGEQISYTVQTSLANGGRYYWRVRCKDPGGSATWSDWSATRYFDVALAAIIPSTPVHWPPSRPRPVGYH